MDEAAGAGDQLDRSRVDGLLTVATQDNQLRSVMARLMSCPDQLTSDGQSRLDEVSAAIVALDQSVVDERNRLLDLLDYHGVEAQADGGELGDRPLHVMSFEVDGAATDKAAATFETAGYRRLAPTSDAKWRAFRATQSGCGFVRTDREPFRIQLQWKPGRLASGPMSRFITPNGADFEAIDLPQSLWAGYLLVHLLKLPARFVRRRAEPANLGPFLQTPDALIEPLLRFADLQSDELLIDLGCGDGRIPIAASTLFGSRARGVEYDAELVERAQHAIAASLVADLVEVVLGDASTAALDDADVVVAFLPVDTLTTLVPEILSRLRPGGRLIVHEQERLDVMPSADVQTPLISAGGVTVAHRWNR